MRWRRVEPLPAGYLLAAGAGARSCPGQPHRTRPGSRRSVVRAGVQAADTTLEPACAGRAATALRASARRVRSGLFLSLAQLSRLRTERNTSIARSRYRAQSLAWVAARRLGMSSRLSARQLFGEDDFSHQGGVTRAGGPIDHAGFNELKTDLTIRLPNGPSEVDLPQAGIDEV